MINFEFQDHYTFEDLRRIVAILRHPGGCPWDREQTHESLRRCTLEETCEVLEAIDRKDDALLCEELGDLLLQVVFHASLAEDGGRFTLDDVADGICKKLIYRHPHVFGTAQADTSEQVLQNWDVLKRAEKGQTNDTDTLRAVARTLPALWRAEKIQKKAAKAGVTAPGTAAAADELSAALEAFRRAEAEGRGVRQALGEVLFAAVAAARLAGEDPEEVLNEASDAYIARFALAEQEAARQGRALSDLAPEETVRIWKQTEQQQDVRQEENRHE